jgi:N-acetylmuramoyl-L-alanine amidase
MVYYGTIKHAEIYINNYPYKTITQIKSENPCNLIFNGTWYSGTSPVGNFKVNGAVLSNEYDQCLGYAWDNGEVPVMRWTDMSDCDNFICACPMIYNGEKLTLNYNIDVGGSRPRTALGQLSNGGWLFICTDESEKYTPEELQDYMYSLGCTSAMMMDGGGSSQMICPAGDIITSRTIYNFMCFDFYIYRVQVGAFHNIESAYNLKETFQDEGYNGFVVKV